MRSEPRQLRAETLPQVYRADTAAEGKVAFRRSPKVQGSNVDIL